MGHSLTTRASPGSNECNRCAAYIPEKPPISDSVIRGMLASKSAIRQASSTYILYDSLFAFST